MNNNKEDYNFITKFSSFTANSYAEEVSKNNSDVATEKAKKLIKYIESCYEGKIKKALKKNPKCHSIDISLPYFQRVKNDDIQDKTYEMVENHFKGLGFAAGMHNGSHCSCPLDFFCNHSTFHIRLIW